jgi:hypothetical protein
MRESPDHKETRLRDAKTIRIRPSHRQTAPSLGPSSFLEFFLVLFQSVYAGVSWITSIWLWDSCGRSSLRERPSGWGEWRCCSYIGRNSDLCRIVRNCVPTWFSAFSPFPPWAPLFTSVRRKVSRKMPEELQKPDRGWRGCYLPNLEPQLVVRHDPRQW